MMMSIRDELHQEIEDTRNAFHQLLEKIPDEALFTLDGIPCLPVK